MKEEIEQLKNIRKRISKIYMKLGNPEEVSADWQLNKDIKFFEESQSD